VKLERVRPSIALKRPFVALPPVKEEPILEEVEEDTEMPSEAGVSLEPEIRFLATDIAASAFVAPATAAGNSPEAAAGATEGATADADTAPAGSATIGMNSAPPANEAGPTLADSLPRQPEKRAVDPASSSSSSAYCSGTGVPAAPAVAAPGVFDPSARMATGCRTKKVGVAGVELSKSNQSVCFSCDTRIAKAVPRFLYWHSTKAPSRWIHTGCIVGLPFSAAELSDNLSSLSPTEPILREAVVDAMAALAARAF
jgi:hypothetical protein